MRRFLQKLSALCYFLFPVLVSGQVLPFTHYTPENEISPLPSAEIYKVYQDRLGYIWMAVFSSGLVRYDGHNMELYTTADGLVDLGLWEILEDKTGRLWISSNAGLVVSEEPLDHYLEGKRIRFVSSLGTVKLMQTSIQTNRLAIDARGWVWVGTLSKGIIRYRFENSGKIAADTISTDIGNEGKNLSVRSLTVRKDGSVWAGVGVGFILVFENESDRYQVLSEEQGLPKQNVNVLYESPAGVLWGGGRKGVLWRLEEKNGQRYAVSVKSEMESNLQSILATSENELWVASEGSGLMKMNPQDSSSKTIYTRKNGLLSENVHHFMQDREGNFWIAQSGGVSKLRRNYAAFENLTAVSYLGESPMLPSPSVNSVLPEVNLQGFSGLLAGTSEGGVAFIRAGGETASIQSDQGLRDNWVNGLTIDEKGRLWIGTTRGINCLSFDSKTALPKAQELREVFLLGRKARLAGYPATSIYTCKRLSLPEQENGEETIPSLWFCGYQNLYVLINDEWLMFKEASGLPVTLIHAVALDDSGVLWVGTRDQGLYRSLMPLSLAKLKTFETREVAFESGQGSGKFGSEIISSVFEQVWSRADGAPSNQIETLIWRDSVLWVGTAEGLAALAGNPPRLTGLLTQKDGLNAKNATSIAFSPVTGSLWVGTNGGLAEIDPKTCKILRKVTKQDGLVNNEVWFYESVALGQDGTVYFGTAKGLSIYRPHADRANTLLPLLRIKEIRFQQDDSGNNEVAIEYAALSFANEKLVRYSTRLVGYDKNWSPETADFKIRYTNLPAFLFSKRYTFEVMARNNDGYWSDSPLQYSFVVQPAWWLRWWSMVLQFALLVGIVFAIQRYRTRQLRNRSRILEHTVRERTAEIQAALENLKATQAQLLVHEKLASMGQLTAGIAHEIKNPLNFVNNFAALSVDLAKELREEIMKLEARAPQQELSDDLTNIEEILDALVQNSEKINQHGKRADGIVQSMLRLSRGKSGERQLADLNALLDEAVNLTYHGLRAQNASFNITIEREYDESIGKLQVEPQEIQRVFLNLINNACYALQEKARGKAVKIGKNEREPAGVAAHSPAVGSHSFDNAYSPTLWLKTKNLGARIEIRIRDNGNGIPAEIREKIFNPFFTTKPTGQGTGLGLSISYDIIAREHGGELRVESEEGSFTEFVICLEKP